jgi:hypothetical protein
MVQPLWKTVCQFIIQLNTILPYDPAISLLGIYPIELKIFVHRKIYTWKFIGALTQLPKLGSNQDGLPYMDG